MKIEDEIIELDDDTLMIMSFEGKDGQDLMG